MVSKTIPDCITRLSGLIKLDVKECRELVALPPLPHSLQSLDAQGCASLQRIDSSPLQNPNIFLNFAKCYNLKQKARKLIQTSACKYAVLPGEEVPAHFTQRASSGSLTINSTQRPLLSSFRFIACILLSKVYEDDDHDDHEDDHDDSWTGMSCSVRGNQNGRTVGSGSNQLHMPDLYGQADHLYIFEDSCTLNQDFPEAEETTFSELTFVFRVHDETCNVKGCGVRLLEANNESAGGGGGGDDDDDSGDHGEDDDDDSEEDTGEGDKCGDDGEGGEDNDDGGEGDEGGDDEDHGEDDEGVDVDNNNKVEEENDNDSGFFDAGNTEANNEHHSEDNETDREESRRDEDEEKRIRERMWQTMKVQVVRMKKRMMMMMMVVMMIIIIPCDDDDYDEDDSGDGGEERDDDESGEDEYEGHVMRMDEGGDGTTEVQQQNGQAIDPQSGTRMTSYPTLTLMQSGYSRPFYGNNPMHQGGDEQAERVAAVPWEDGEDGSDVAVSSVQKQSLFLLHC
ncbi:BnaC05g19170D [Brassica napus]|uniref:(rape) hypothetical protein n=1 Tax=Brassica napus TaxID=3708 RepID=A0A078FJQ5_BRANA|nr:unnamed protein product [Brassica napus]CDY14660.1 BnaC05g19170D [Brassica napus]